MTCPELDDLKRGVQQAEDAIRFQEGKIKRLDQLTYSQIRQIELETEPLAHALDVARRRVTAHPKKCKRCGRD